MGKRVSKKSSFINRVVKELDYPEEIPEEDAIADVAETIEAIKAVLISDLMRDGVAEIPGILGLTRKEEPNRLTGEGTVTTMRASVKPTLKARLKKKKE